MKKSFISTGRVPVPCDRSYWVVDGLLLAGAYPTEAPVRVAVPSDGPPYRYRWRSPKVHPRLDAILECGVRTFVNLIEATEQRFDGSKFLDYRLYAASKAGYANFLQFPIKDNGITDRRKMHQILDAMDSSIDAGLPVYVHCWGGIGRTATVVGCWLRRRNLASKMDVLTVIDRLRKQDVLRCNFDAPATLLQRDFVEEFA